MDIEERNILQTGAVAAAAMFGVLVGGCAIVDSSMILRVDAINGGYDSAINNEILTNIVRASHYQGLRFYSHNKIAPSQSSDWKLGLPSITVGHSATPRQYIFAGNLADNSASLSLELDPIETRDFHNSLLTPISVGTIGILLQNFPKELVYLALLESIRFQKTTTDGTPVGNPIEYKNDPMPPSDACPDDDYSEEYYPGREGQAIDGRTIKKYNRYYHPPGQGQFLDLSNCKYQRFYYWVQTAVAYGLTVTFSTVTNPKYVETDTKGTQPKTVVAGRFCFDAAQAQPLRAKQPEGLLNTCDKRPNPPPVAAAVPVTVTVAVTAPPPAKASASATATAPLTVAVTAPVPEKATATATATATANAAAPALAPAAITLDDAHVKFNFTRPGFEPMSGVLELVPRSLAGVFLYLGRIAIAPSHGQGLVPLYSAEARSNGDINMLTTTNDTTDDCFAVAALGKERYCVPSKDTDNTKRVFALLAELIALSSTASDIPTSLTVRVTP